MDRKDFYVGQQVFVKILKGSNAARGIKSDKPEDWIKTKEVTKVGKKYLTVASAEEFNGRKRYYCEIIFDMSNGFRHVTSLGSRDYVLFLSKEDALDSIERNTIFAELQKRFDILASNNYTLDQLRRIKEILEEN